MARLTPALSPLMSNEGQVVSLPDGRNLRFLWSGTISEVSNSLLLRYAHRKNGNLSQSGSEFLTCDLLCRQCNHEFMLYEYYYNRKAPNANRKSRFYCLDCALHLKFIELVQETLA